MPWNVPLELIFVNIAWCVCKNHKMKAWWWCVCRVHTMMLSWRASRVKSACMPTNYECRTHNMMIAWCGVCRIYGSQTKILECWTKRSMILFEALFNVSWPKSGTHTIENCVEETHRDVRSTVQNLRLGSTKFARWYKRWLHVACRARNPPIKGRS